ncbi:MAG: methylenetetrahydrofolate--tRNA-(uracil(54)-C(5))-methyltransferase (FADH(2)-oxidizing) TrmFO [Chloroflexota bacterium]|nr:methylenetetrahydrofolate--tRNA-(uracil(54)-C(5))-methyltransferase (FADH(2)-oxidizing) TrmFO [Chloroflexota bacterium]MDE2910186.1 methylenetetrahydrofolate--tRNA-(uracil(54)-C(5))-methyltransferase (FADH(2)-oxidizing) TrmFO [Chloroflexota bacterium]
MSEDVIVIGGGLAGSEAAWQLAERGHRVTLFEMRPAKTTGAHVSHQLAELVCSNSLGSKLPDRATGILQREMKLLGSLLMRCAEEAAVPAGGALAVDRAHFADLVTSHIFNHPSIEVVREEAREVPLSQPAIVATGPLTSPALAQAIGRLTGEDYLYFYDAISPIARASSIDMARAFRANRYGRGQNDAGDYINCPMERDEYYQFVRALQAAETIELRDFEREDPNFFEGCVPIEALAKRGDDTLAFGPMRPVGLTNPHTGKRPYAVAQLRQDDLAGNLYNIVGFQTNIRWKRQAEILRLIPGLERAEFIRMGQMHRNTFLNAPALLQNTMRFRAQNALYFAGQITGVEGYVGNIATGFVAAINLSRQLAGLNEWAPPADTMLGALCYYVTHTDPKRFQPMKANLGILPPLPTKIKDKTARRSAYAARAEESMLASLRALQDRLISASVEMPQRERV